MTLRDFLKTMYIAGDVLIISSNYKVADDEYEIYYKEGVRGQVDLIDIPYKDALLSNVDFFEVEDDGGVIVRIFTDYELR